MNAFEKVQAAARSISIYSCPDIKRKRDNRKKWITYNLVSETGQMFGDDTAQDMVAHVQVHLFLPAPVNFYSDRNALRDALIRQGFTYPEMVNNSLEGNNNEIRHIVFECRDDEERED